MTPTQFSEKTTSHLQDLIRINIDSAEGFETSAETVSEPRLASLFRDMALLRTRFAAQLQDVVSLDEEPRDSGSVMGTAHRWWLQVRGAITSENAYAVLAEAERGEDAIKEAYEKALAEVVEPDIRRLLEDQYLDVKAGHDRVRDLRDAYKQAS